MEGLHCVADLSDCPLERLCDVDRVLVQCRRLVEQAGLQAVAELVHVFDAPEGHSTSPAGFTCTLLLAESHLCLHTWPERLAVTLDVYVCNYRDQNSHKARQLMRELIDWFEPGRFSSQEIWRGQHSPSGAGLDGVRGGEAVPSVTVPSTQTAKP